MKRTVKNYSWALISQLAKERKWSWFWPEPNFQIQWHKASEKAKSRQLYKGKMNEKVTKNVEYNSVMLYGNRLQHSIVRRQDEWKLSQHTRSKIQRSQVMEKSSNSSAV